MNRPTYVAFIVTQNSQLKQMQKHISAYVRTPIMDKLYQKATNRKVT